MKKSKIDKATSYAYRLFSIRQRSEKELRDRLYKKRFKRDTINKVISLFKEKKIIDDLKFARNWIDQRMRLNPKGEALLKRELRAKGVELVLIEEALNNKDKNETSIVRELADKKMKTLTKEPKEKAKRKLFGFLARRGFDFDTVNEVIKEYL